MSKLELVCKILCDRENLCLKNENTVLLNEKAFFTDFFNIYATNAFFRASLNLICKESENGFLGVDLVDEILFPDDNNDDNHNIPPIITTKLEEEALLMLSRIGFAILKFNDNSNCRSCAFWHNRPLSKKERETYDKFNWEYKPPCVDYIDFKQCFNQS